MFKKIIGNKKLRSRILITVLLVLLFRTGTLITMPGANVTEQYFDQGSFLGVLNMLGGGGLSSFSLFALGVTPYITASIIIQLLSSDVIPPLARLQKQGEKGRIKVEKITRIVALFFAILQGLAISLAMISAGYVETAEIFGNSDWTYLIIFTLFLVAGAFISMWIADQITMKGVGNGTSMLIFVGIIGGMPTKIIQTFGFMQNDSEGIASFLGVLNFILFLSLSFTTIYILGFFETSERRIPIQQTGQGLNLIEDKETYLPMKVNPAGIVPVIFASAIITLPPTIAQFFPESSSGAYWVETWFDLTHPFGLTVYALLIIGFTFFYSQININPVETADNFQKSSTFIMGVKPGDDTERHIRRTLNSMSLIGATVLTFVAILPYLMTFVGIPESIAIGGTSLIILVSVGIDTWEQVKARALASQDKQYILNKTRKFNKFGEVKEIQTKQSEKEFIF